jgi:flagellar biosynthesis chaperone FliJ
MPFRFRLEIVLDWQQKILEQEKMRTAECHRLMLGVQDAIARLHAEHLMIEREWLDKKAIPGSDAASLGLYRLGVRKAERTLLTEQERRGRDLSQQMAKMLEAQRKLRVLENLRGRKRREYTYLRDRELEQLAAESHLAVWGAHNRQVASAALGPQR